MDKRNDDAAARVGDEDPGETGRPLGFSPNWQYPGRPARQPGQSAPVGINGKRPLPGLNPGSGFRRVAAAGPLPLSPADSSPSAVPTGGGDDLDAEPVGGIAPAPLPQFSDAGASDSPTAEQQAEAVAPNKVREGSATGSPLASGADATESEPADAGRRAGDEESGARPAVAASVAVNPPAERNLLLDLDELERAAEQPDDPVFGAMAPGIVALLVGEAGIGKSAIALAIAVAVAAGKPFAGIKPPRPQPVVVYSPEDSTTVIGRRIKAACIELGANRLLVKQNLYVVSDVEPFTLFEQDGSGPKLSKGGLRLIEAAKRVGARLVIPEPLVELHMASENDNGQMHAVFSKFRSLARDLGCAILIGHHTTKDKGTPRGAGSIVGTARVIMNVERLDAKEVEYFKKMGKEEVDLFKLELGKVSHFRREPGAKFFERVSVDFGDHSAPALHALTR